MGHREITPKPLEEILAPRLSKTRRLVECRGQPGERKPLWAILGEEPPIGWGLTPENGGSAAGGVVLAQRAQETGPELDTGGDTPAATLVPVDVPGAGRTYFDPEVAPRVKDFIDRTQQAGIDIQFASGFRSTGRQKALLTDPTATTPATPGNSLHEAGRAFDISIKNDDGTPRFSEEQFRQIVDFGRQVGFNWGGEFRKPDPGHFFVEVPEGIGNRGPRIQRAQDYFRNRLESK